MGFFKDKKKSKLSKEIKFLDNRFCITCGKRGIYSFSGRIITSVGAETKWLYCHDCEYVAMPHITSDGKWYIHRAKFDENFFVKTDEHYQNHCFASEMFLEIIESRNKQDVKKMKIKEIKK